MLYTWRTFCRLYIRRFIGQFSAGSTPWDKGGGGEMGGGAGHSDPEMAAGAASNKFFSALRASVWSENKVGPRTPQAPPLDPSLQLTAKVLLLNNWSFATNTTKGTVDYHYTLWMYVLYMWLGTCFTCDLVFFVCLFVCFKIVWHKRL